MKNLFITILLFFACLNVTAQKSPEILTNDTVISLVKKGLGASIVIMKIKTTKTNFDVSTSGLIKLKENNVPDEVVSAIVDAASNKESAPADPNNPLSKHNSGIYYYNPKDSLKRLLRVDPTVVSSNKSGGVGTAVAQHFTYGIANNKEISSVSGSNARKQLKDTDPVFYFYFEKSTGTLNNSADWWFTSATSPNEFALVKLSEKKNSREFTAGQSNAYGSSVGISEKQKVPFDYEEVGENIYKVTLRGVKPGEYCFVFTGAVPSIYSNDKVFDFGIY